ncbi:hypothetical protein [Propionispora hippei]|uniref:hypothetical protein n=1 Tax=Propionispora hippei TaxID=209080 RepID=UPI00122C3531|nr:hypothetical protein [Propionispora hippei]
MAVQSLLIFISIASAIHGNPEANPSAIAAKERWINEPAGQAAKDPSGSQEQVNLWFSRL